MLEDQLITPGLESTAILSTGYGCDTSEHCYVTKPIESF
jgi:hypothetical protein